MAQENEIKEIRVKWGSTDNMDFKYVNNAVIMHSDDSMFHITFGHLVPVNTANTSKEELPDQVEIRPVACLVIPPESLEKIIKAFNTNIEKYNKKQGMKNAANDDCEQVK